jgi:acetylornithine deacetylase/succinyl-diaminopimelate desuccinylase-like protein
MDVLPVLEVLAGTASPRGHERALATRLASWAAARWPALGFTVDPVGDDGANVVAVSARGDAPGLLLYSHLDTSLTGDPLADYPVTGRSGSVAPFAVAGGIAGGFGLGVAKAPAAAAIAGFAAAAASLRGVPHRLTLLLASAGTHWSPFDRVVPSGVSQFLAQYPKPAAAIVAKGGPPGILVAEPGAMFVRIRLEAAFAPVLARDTAVPPGGLVSDLARVLSLVEGWRAEHLAARPPGAVAAEVGIGAVRGGLPGKPDLLPGLVELHLYVVTVPGDDPAAIAASLSARVGARVDASLVHPAAATAAHAPIVGYATAAWTAAFGAPPPPVTGWKGSTDGVVLRAHGIDTVRTGPRARPDPDDPRRDLVDVAQLVRFAAVYADTAVRYARSGEVAS